MRQEIQWPMTETIAFSQGMADKFIKLANVSHLPKTLGVIIANLT